MCLPQNESQYRCPLASLSTTLFKHFIDFKYHTLSNELSKTCDIVRFPFEILSMCETQAVEVQEEDFFQTSLGKEDSGHLPKSRICHISQILQVSLNTISKLIHDTVNLFMTV